MSTASATLCAILLYAITHLVSLASAIIIGIDLSLDLLIYIIQGENEEDKNHTTVIHPPRRVDQLLPAYILKEGRYAGSVDGLYIFQFLRHRLKPSASGSN